MSNPPTNQPSIPSSGYSSSATAYISQPQPKITQPQPIVTQPTAGQSQVQVQGQFDPPSGSWMAIPAQVPSNLLPSIQYLATVHHLLMKQENEKLGVFAGWEGKRKYTIKNNVGQRVFFAVEETDWLNECCYSQDRSFTIRVLDINGIEIIKIRRDSNFIAGCCGRIHTVEVYSPPNVLVGKIKQNNGNCTVAFDVKNRTNQTVLKLFGRTCSMLPDEFKIYSPDSSVLIGKILKQWSGLPKQYFKDDYFGITFPHDLDVRMKAVLIGACFLVDITYFEVSYGYDYYDFD